MSIFSRIIRREIPAYIIAEDEKFLAFLDVFPLAEGHTLVIPKQEIDYFFDIDDELLGEMMVFAKKVAQKLRAAIDCKKIGVAVIGLEVAHAHIHLVPLQNVGDLNFNKPKLQLTAPQMQAIQNKIVGI